MADAPNLAAPVMVVVRLTQADADAVDDLVRDEANESGHNVSRAAVCRKLIARGLRETQRKRKGK